MDASLLEDELGPSGKGFVLLRGFLSQEVVRRALRALDVALPQTPDDVHGASKRVLNLLDLDAAAFGAMVGALTSLLPSLEVLMGRGLLLGSFHAHVLLPTPDLPLHTQAVLKDYNVHTDFPYWRRDAGPRDPASVQVLFMLTEFTSENGATLVLPGSHSLGRGPVRLASGPVLPPPAPRECRPLTASDKATWDGGYRVMEGSPGDALVYSGQLWHAAGLNLSPSLAPRIAVLASLHPFYTAPLEPLALTTRPSSLRCLGPRARALVLGTEEGDGNLPPSSPPPPPSSSSLLATTVPRSALYPRAIRPLPAALRAWFLYDSLVNEVTANDFVWLVAAMVGVVVVVVVVLPLLLAFVFGGGVLDVSWSCGGTMTAAVSHLVSLIGGALLATTVILRRLNL